MKKFVIMGVQGSGKGTQAKRLAKELDLIHISVGDLFRWHIQNRTKLGAKVKRIVSGGALVPDEIVQSRFHPGRVPAQRAPGAILSRALRRGRRDRDRGAGRRGLRAHARAPAVLGLRP